MVMVMMLITMLTHVATYDDDDDDDDDGRYDDGGGDTAGIDHKNQKHAELLFVLLLSTLRLDWSW